MAVSIALALGSTATMAVTAPTASQLPGRGGIISGHVSAGRVVSGQQTITIGNASDTGAANAVINWGAGSAINAGGVGGFNIGASARLGFVDGSGHGAAVLNIDSSGNPSQIYGKLSGTGTSIFVANANGIVVGSGASIASASGVGLIANKTLSGTGADFKGAGSIAYSGSGGNVTVLKGASINAPSVLIAGGGNVNINLAAFTGASGSARLSAGVASTGGGANNRSASLTTSGALAGASLGGFQSAGNALNSGTLVLDSYSVGGLFTNTGKLTLPARNGAVLNKNQLITTVAATFSALTNDGSYMSKGVSVVGGNLVNNGKLWGATLRVTDGSLINSGSIAGVYNLITASDAHGAAGADYSISNTGTITSYGGLTVDANRSNRSATGSSTGSFTSTGILRLALNHNLTVKSRNDITLAGRVQAGSGANALDLSSYDPKATLGTIVLSASGYNATVATPTFWTNGSLNVLAPLASTSGMILHGRQVKLMGDVGVVAFAADGSVNPHGTISVVAGGSMAAAHDYAVTVGDGATVSAGTINVTGPSYRSAPTDGRVERPNVLLQGLLSASSAINLGTAAAPVSDVFSTGEEDVSGLVVTGNTPGITIAFTGDVGRAPELRGTDFHNDYLPIDGLGAETSTLTLKPLNYLAHAGTVNLLVDGNVLLTPPTYTHSPAIYGSGSATTPAKVPNTSLTLQVAGNLTLGAGSFYWPGAVYLGTIGYGVDGLPAPDSLGDGTITFGGNFSNVLPGSIASNGGIEFITQRPMGMRSYTVTTNANSPISFGTAELTADYASGKLGKGLFFGGKQGSNGVVNYGPLAASMFRTDAPPPVVE